MSLDYSLRSFLILLLVRNVKIQPQGLSLLLIANKTINSCIIPHYSSVLPLCLVLTTACSWYSPLWLLLYFNIPMWSQGLYFLTSTHTLHTICPSHSFSSKTSYIILPLCFCILHCSPVSCDFCNGEQSSRLSHLKEKLIKHHFTAHWIISEWTTDRCYIHNLLITHYQLSLTDRNILRHKTFIIKWPPWHVNLGRCLYSVIHICLLFMSKKQRQDRKWITGDVPEVTGHNTSTFHRQTKLFIYFFSQFIYLSTLKLLWKNTVHYASNLHHIHD